MLAVRELKFMNQNRVANVLSGDGESAYVVAMTETLEEAARDPRGDA